MFSVWFIGFGKEESGKFLGKESKVKNENSPQKLPTNSINIQVKRREENISESTSSNMKSTTHEKTI